MTGLSILQVVSALERDAEPAASYTDYHTGEQAIWRNEAAEYK